MFSSMIQNLLSTSGQANAMQRAVQMNNYARNISAQWMPVEKTAQNQIKPNTVSFDKVLQEGAKVKFGDLLTNPVTKVNAQIYTNTASGVAVKENFTTKSKIKSLISRVSQKHGVDEKLVNAVIKQESGYNPKAKSSAGAQGLMQLMPATAKSLGVKNAFDPQENIEGG